jgi:RNA polymerase sigma-70 factor, ECF subfamily
MIDHEVTDEALLVAARTDAEAFTRFYRRHAPPVLGYLVRRTGDPELGADLTAETFACALEGLARFDPERGTAVNWLFGIARHQLLHTLRRGRVERRARDRLGMPRLELDDEDLERILALAESESTAALIADALETLPPDQRAAIDARVLAEQDYDAIARRTGTTEATIRKRVSRALDSLRNTLGGGPS